MDNLLLHLMKKPEFSTSQTPCLQVSTLSSNARTEAAGRKCSSKLVFLKISQYSQKNNCVGVSF